MRLSAIARFLAAVVAISALALPASASVVASDGFSVPPYSVATIAGQTAFGSGFSGTWTRIAGLLGDLSVNASGVVGRPSGPLAADAGDYAVLASPFALGSGQFYFSVNIANQGAGNLSSTRLDLNFSTASPFGGSRVHLGGEGVNATFNLQVEGNLSSGGTQVTAQTSVPSTGTHQLAGVLDLHNNQVAIFVDPNSASFYHPDGTNNATAVAAWSPAAGLTLSSYSLIKNVTNVVNYGGVVFATDPASVGIGTASVPVMTPPALAILALLLLGLGAWAVTRRHRPA